MDGLGIQAQSSKAVISSQFNEQPSDVSLANGSDMLPLSDALDLKREGAERVCVICLVLRQVLLRGYPSGCKKEGWIPK